ncbi:MAG: FAD-dependent oxidoreductase [Chloroflexia bacterium]|nr:FAD-dependent oxidoreductase [Chloroflexia bacterium]
MFRSSSGPQCDLLVIGGGTAGLVGAKTAASLKARVLLVERDRPGGDCLWTGCVPSKSLIAAAAIAAQTARATSLGTRTTGRDVDFTAVMDHVQAAIRTIAPADSFDALRAGGVQVMAGDAVFVAPQAAEINGERIRFRQALVATGAAPALPDIPGLPDIEIRTSENIWNLATLPQRLAIIGGGAIGCELGQAFARLGSQVTIVTRGPRLLTREDPGAAARVTSSMVADGVTIRTIARVTGVIPSGPAGVGSLRLENGPEVPFDALLVATGRSPRTRGLGLEAAGIETADGGHIKVNDQLRTTNPFVWAAGDVTSRSNHTHTAGVHGSIAASNAILGLKRTIATRAVPRITFTVPELAAVGVSTDPAQTSAGVRVLTWNHAELDRAITQCNPNGMTRLAVDRKGRIVGATVVSPRAGETLGEITLAIRHGMRTRDLASVTHAYPTYNDAVWNLAIRDARRGIVTGFTGKTVHALALLRRAWVRLRQAGR